MQAKHTPSAPAIMLSISGKILLLRSTSYPKKYFAWDKAITMAEAVVKPEMTEWLMKRIIHPSLDRRRIQCKWNYKTTSSKKKQIKEKIRIKARTGRWFWILYYLQHSIYLSTMLKHSKVVSFGTKWFPSYSINNFW